MIDIPAMPLRQASPGASAQSRLGAVVFIHRFGALLNPHPNFHCVVVDGVFDTEASGELVFHEASGLDSSAITAVQAIVRRRLLRAAQRRGLLTEDDAQAMAGWAHGKQTDRLGGAAFTDGIVRIFSNDLAPLAAARGAGLALLDHLPFARHFVARRMIYGARG